MEFIKLLEQYSPQEDTVTAFRLIVEKYLSDSKKNYIEEKKKITREITEMKSKQENLMSIIETHIGREDFDFDQYNNRLNELNNRISIMGIKSLGIVTPIGGLCFMFAWVAFAAAFIPKK